jgi:hypothetical protein
MGSPRIATPHFHSRSTHRVLMYIFTHFAADPSDQPSPRPSTPQPLHFEKTASLIPVSSPDYQRTLRNPATAPAGQDHRSACPCGFLTHLARHDVQRMTEAPAFPPPDLA